MSLSFKKILKIIPLAALPFFAHANPNTFSANQIYNFCLGDPASIGRIKNNFAPGTHVLLEQAAINDANNIAGTICDAYVGGYVDGLYAGQAFPPTNSNMFYATAKAAFINYIQTYPNEGKLSAVVVMTRALLKNNIVYAKNNKGGK